MYRGQSKQDKALQLHGNLQLFENKLQLNKSFLKMYFKLMFQDIRTQKNHTIIMLIFIAYDCCAH